MGIFYGARHCRWDLVCPTTWLTRYLTRWSRAHDKMLFRLVSYLWCTLEDTMSGFVADAPGSLYLQHSIDADHGGDVLDIKATSGGHLMLKGPHTAFPFLETCKKQTCSSNGSTEAEVVSLSWCMRMDGLPMVLLWETLLNRRIRILVLEDNIGTIQAIEKGYSPALRHLPKTQKTSLDFLNYLIHVCKLVDIEYVATELQIADIFTKAVKVADWAKACHLLGICHSEWLEWKRQLLRNSVREHQSL